MPCHCLAGECTLPADDGGEDHEEERASSSCGGVAPRPPICLVGLICETQRPITHRPEGGFQEAAQPNFSPLRAMSGFAFGFTIPPVVLSRWVGLEGTGLSRRGTDGYGPWTPPARFTVTVFHFLDRPAAQSPSSLSESPLHQARLVTVGVNRARIAGTCRLGAATANPKVAPYRSLGKSQRCVWGVDPWHTGYDKPTSLTTAAAVIISQTSSGFPHGIASRFVAEIWLE
ncbi:hypothetical protein CPLU01_09592 [Colletotrichum plurivorum]|uniref:Uncharacterized protein n=1 Tax=Colletotrichum plurivorum TaxID=2175906 RepID=A0A8H6K8P3_9PEZI|nr:hypothetical protein CPLU01_09592 [Colletotrichum plurivorum]